MEGKSFNCEPDHCDCVYCHAAGNCNTAQCKSANHLDTRMNLTAVGHKAPRPAAAAMNCGCPGSDDTCLCQSASLVALCDK
jgi:hypothetical protein